MVTTSDSGRASWGSHPDDRAAYTDNSIRTINGPRTPTDSSQTTTVQPCALELQHFHLNHVDIPDYQPTDGLFSPPLSDNPSSEPSSPMANQPLQETTASISSASTTPRCQRKSRSLPRMLEAFLRDPQTHEGLATGAIARGRGGWRRQRALRAIELLELGIRPDRKIA